MLLLDVITVILTLASLLSLRYVRDRLLPLETVVNFLAVTVLIEQIHSAIVYNYFLISFPANLYAYLVFKLFEIAIIPAATLWLIYAFRSPFMKGWGKAVLGAVWFCGLEAAYRLFDRLEVFKLTGWNVSYSLIVWGFVFFVSLRFSLWFRSLLCGGDGHGPLFARDIR